MNPLPFDQLERLLADWSYKPGYEYHLYAHPYEGTHLAIVLTVPNAYRPDEAQPQCIRAAVPPMFDSVQFYEWLLWRSIRFEIHEACEFGRVSGKVFRDPHSDAYAAAGFDPTPQSDWFTVPPGMQVTVMSPEGSNGSEL